jgi:hypothetical protein
LGADGDEVPAKHQLSKKLVARLKAKPCEVLEEIFRARDDSKMVCSKLRRPNGELLLALSLKAGDLPVELMKAGQRCRGGLVVADTRPKKVPRWISYLSVSLQATDEQTLDFSGWDTSVKQGTDGSLETIGKGCGPEIEGRVRFAGKQWRLLGPRSEGCSE